MSSSFIASQAAWIPIDHAIVNHSNVAWTTHFSPAPTARMGFVITRAGAAPDSADPVGVCTGKVVLPPGARMTFYADEPSPGHRTPGRLRFLVCDQAKTQSELMCILEVQTPGDQSFFIEERRFPSAHPALQSVFVTPAAILIRNLDPRERKEERKTPVAEARAAGPAARGSLPALSEEDRAAGVEGAVYYTVGRIRYAPDWDPHRTWASALHAKGNILAPESLADMFFNTMFQHYTLRLAGFDAQLNYDQYPRLRRPEFDAQYASWLRRFCHPRGVELFAVPEPGGDFTEFNRYREAFAMTRTAFMGNRDFFNLAVAYMRQKVVTEKLIEAARARIGRGESPKAVNLLVNKHNALCNDLQVMIYNWMDQGYDRFVRDYQQAPDAEKPRAGAFLATFRPAFLSEPYYKDIMDNVRHHMAATTEIEGVALPRK